MDEDLPVFEDSNHIAKFLIEEVGIHDALKTASEEIVQANEAGQFYLLSVWREVRTALDEMVETVE